MTSKNITNKKIYYYSIILLLALLVFIFSRFIFTQFNKADEDSAGISCINIQQETLSSLNDKNNGRSIKTTGVIHAIQEISLHTQIPGTITKIYVKDGSFVSKGDIIAEIDNSAQQAQVLQAIGNLSGAKARALGAHAQHNKVKNTPKKDKITILKTNVQSSEDTYDSSIQNAYTTLLSTYSTIRRTIYDQTDTLFTKIKKDEYDAGLWLTDDQDRSWLKRKRSDIEGMIKRHDKIERSLSSTDEETVKTELKHMTSELNSLVKFTRRLSTAVDDTVIETNTEMHYKQITAAAHSTMLAQLHAISAITDTITRARSAIVISKANLTIATDGAETEDKQFSETNVASAESGIIVAEGGYRGALVNLEKTKIKAPFNGFVTALSVSNGDFINTSSTIGTLLDTSNYEVQFPVPINNVPLLDQEIIVKIKDETYKAYITEIPKITTNKTPLVTITAKIENVKITQQITSGLSVDIYYKKDTIQSHSEKQVIFAVPLNAITFKESKPFVFILNKNIYNNTKSDTETATTTKSTTTVESIEVILGELSNDKINIRSSTLTPGTLIVRDARKIQPGTIVCTDK